MTGQKTTKKEAKPATQKLTQMEAALKVLAKAKEPMNCKQMVEAMAKQRLWTSPGGATPTPHCTPRFCATCARGRPRGSRRSCAGSSPWRDPSPCRVPSGAARPGVGCGRSGEHVHDEETLDHRRRLRPPQFRHAGTLDSRPAGLRREAGPPTMATASCGGTWTTRSRAPARAAATTSTA